VFTRVQVHDLLRLLPLCNWTPVWWLHRVFTEQRTCCTGFRPVCTLGTHCHQHPFPGKLRLPCQDSEPTMTVILTIATHGGHPVTKVAAMVDTDDNLDITTQRAFSSHPLRIRSKAVRVWESSNQVRDFFLHSMHPQANSSIV
jgi:hypothetical protein